MSLPAPNLDDRCFQDLVDDAKRMVQRKWPEWTGWTDHNVSDPGITLIETFAFIADQVLFRLNRVPERTYVKFLELIGVQLQPPTAAVAPITFWLSAPQSHVVSVPEGTEVATTRSETLEPIVFRTVTALDVPSASRIAVAATAAGSDEATDLTDPLTAGRSVALFSASPQPGDCFHVGLSTAVARCAVVLRVRCDVEGYGINPDRPPLRWEAWDGETWSACEVERDETGGFNRPGDILLHVPAGHRMSTVAQRRAGWLRCRVTDPPPGGRAYDATPRIARIDAYVVGGTVDAVHAEEIAGEILGTAEGVPGQRFRTERSPIVLAPEPERLEIIVDAGLDHDVPGGQVQLVSRTEEWVRVDTFADRGPDEGCFTMDPATGEVQLPPAVRMADGSVTRYGKVPPVGAVVRLRSYRTGGGRRGNVAAGALRSIRSSLPLIHRAENRVAATGGVDGESIDDAKVRGPLTLRTRDRAVTAADYEHLARIAAPELARVRCTEVTGSTAGAARVLLVPRVAEGPDGPGRVRFEQLRPLDETFTRVVEHLERRRVIGVRVLVEVPEYHGLTVVARLRTTRRASQPQVEQLALDALYRFFHPVVGGPDGDGWPFGRPVHAAEVHAELQRVPGVDYVDEALLFTYDVHSGERGTSPVERIALPDDGLVFSFAHNVRVEQRP